MSPIRTDKWMMDFTEEMIAKVALDLHGQRKYRSVEKEIHFKRPFRRLSMLDAIRRVRDMTSQGRDEASLRRDSRWSERGDLDDSMGKGKIIDAIFEEKAEPHLIPPTLITDYPVEITPL